MAPKPLSEFPRPPQDNGRGVHWSASVYHVSNGDLQFWLKELKALQIKWIKLLDDGGGSSIELCRALIDNGIMPVVRIFRERPNPGHVSGREIDAIRRLCAAGVRYIETNNEPDLPAEWHNNHMPANWLDVVVDNFIFDADVILGAGGLPALPAMGPGSKDNAVAKVVQRGRKDIFERGGWVAIHNYTLNHPLNYPGDAVNQSGQPVTPEEFAELARWQYGHLSAEEAEKKGVNGDDYGKFQRWAWDGRSIDMVNALRATNKNPGDTIFDDPNCFRSFEQFGQRIFDALGFHVPIISTEGGPVMGWGDDKRYAKINAQTQAAWQLEIYRILQDEAPEWYFSCCTWLLASRPMGDFNPTWDQMSWYTNAWDLQFGTDGQLPIVQRLKDTPSKVRWELRGNEGDTTPIVEGEAIVEGRITGRDGSALAGVGIELRAGEQTAAATVSDGDGRYQLSADAGRYDLFVPWFGPAARQIDLNTGEHSTFDISDMDAPGAYSIKGVVEDEAGAGLSGLAVTLRRNGIVHAAADTAVDGVFAFTPALAGMYALAVKDAGEAVTVSPDQPAATIHFTLPGAEKRYRLIEKRLLTRAETGNDRMFFGRVSDAEGKGIKDIELEMRWTNADPGTAFPRTRTGKNPFKPDPDGYFEFLHSPGQFMIEVVQGDFPSDVADDLLTTGLPAREGDPITYEVDFQLRSEDVQPPATAAISGSIPGGRVGQVVRLRKNQDMTDFALDASQEFRFEGLSAGVYDLVLGGVGTIGADMVVHSADQVEVTFPLLGAIAGRVEDALTQSSIALISETYGFVRHAQLMEGGQYRFSNLPAGRYRVELGDAMLHGLQSDGRGVLIAPPIILDDEPEPENSKLEGVIKDSSGQSVDAITLTLLRGGQEIAGRLTDAQGRYRFEGLPAGEYALAIAGMALASGIPLDGQNTLIIDLIYDALPEIKPLDHYYLLSTADPALRPALVRLLAPWLAAQPAGVLGFSLGEAGQAAIVTVIGDGITDSDIVALQTNGSQAIDRRQDLLALAAEIA